MEPNLAADSEGVRRAGAGFWQSAVTDEQTLWFAGLTALFAVMLGILALTAWRLGRMQRRPNGAVEAGVDATATIEFALLFPVALGIILMLAQTTLLVNANVFVNYAAFAACRSAIVQIPTDYFDNPPNEITFAAGYEKYDTIHRTAAMALMPIAGRSGAASGSTGAAPTTGVTGGLDAHYSGYGQQAPPWIDQLIAQRLQYTLAHTQVLLFEVQMLTPNEFEFVEVPLGTTHTFAPRDPVTIRVLHQFRLTIPYANRLFATGENDGGQYREIAAQTTLPNEGVIDTLPPEPTVPRFP